ncbi:TetR/AcrR family transcriptional regulator [Xylophilus sp. GW821-FHT01B05]
MKVMTNARREAIVEAASQLFQEFGYEGASMNELATRLGGSKATLYRYFPSKDALFDAVVRASSTSHLAKAVEELQATAGPELRLEETLHRFGETVLRVMTDSAEALAVYRMVVAESGRSEVGELFYAAGPQECLTALTALMKKAMDAGLLRDADPAIMADHFLALVTAESERRIFQRSPPPMSVKKIKATVARAVDMFLRGAGAP